MPTYSIAQCRNCGNYHSEHLEECPACHCENPVFMSKAKRVELGRLLAEPVGKVSKLEEKFLEEWAKTGLPTPIAEYYFHLKRKWRFDFCWPDLRLAIECEGGTWNGGRHTTGSGYAGDCEKYNAAAELGYFVLRYPKVDSEAIAQVERVYRQLDRAIP